MFGNLGTTELIVILLIGLLIFGSRKLSQLSRSAGKGVGEFRRASEGLKRTWQQAITLDDNFLPPPPTPSTPSTETKPARDDALHTDKTTEDHN